MSSIATVQSRPRTRRTSVVRRGTAWLARTVSDDRASLSLALCVTAAHVALWTVILTILKGAQDIHFDVAEAYGWGQRFLLGYGKHPPLSGWVAGVWFRVFPVEDWAAYALAMTTCGVGMLLCYAIALKVTDRRRAFLVMVMVATYPIFNFKGFKYNADLIQLVTLPLLVLAYLHAFEKRTLLSGILLGLAGAAALMTKYWVLTMIGAIGIAALLHPERLKFLRSPAPWAAIAVLAVTIAPHVAWLARVDFLPLTYAGGTYHIASRWQTIDLVVGYIGHNAALLALPVALGALALAWWPPSWRAMMAQPSALVTRAWSVGENAGVRLSPAINVWIIQMVVAIGPPLGALAFNIYLKTDWGIPLFFLVPLALVAIPALRVQRAAPLRLLAIWLVLTLATLAGARDIAAYTERLNAADVTGYGARSDLARQLTRAWHMRFVSRWAVVAAATDIGEPMTFYSTDHPVTLTPGEVWSSGLTSLEDARRQGFIGICNVDDDQLAKCEAWMSANAGNAERLSMTTRRFYHGAAGPLARWKVFIVPPGS